jgi:hypothetical protein
MSNADLSTAEVQLGHALAIIHRILPRLDDPARSAEVQAGLQNAIAALKNAAAAHTGVPMGNVKGTLAATAAVAPEIAAVIAAAVATLLDRPHRVLAVQQVNMPEVISHLNVWAYEGRTQIFTSHRVR